MNAYMVHFTFEFKTGLRNAVLLMMNYLFPLGFYVLMGLVMTQVNPAFLETMIPALVIFIALASTVLGLPSPLVEQREAGIFRTYKINGVPAPAILIIPALSTIFHAAFGALGALIGVASANSRATVLWSQLIFLPSMLIGGLMLPLSLIPQAMLPFAALLPPAHAMQALVGLAYGQETVLNPTVSAGVLLATVLLGFGLAIYLFDWDRVNRARRGHPLMALLVLVPYVVGMFLG